MAKILILGGGFGGVVAAESLANELGNEHQITLVSRSRRFVFYPALVRLAFGKCALEDVSFDLRQTMLSRRVNFIEAEVARIDPDARTVTAANGETEGKLFYDYDFTNTDDEALKLANEPVGVIASICPWEILLLRLRIFSQRCPINNVWLPDSKDNMEVC